MENRKPEEKKKKLSEQELKKAVGGTDIVPPAAPEPNPDSPVCTSTSEFGITYRYKCESCGKLYGNNPPQSCSDCGGKLLFGLFHK